MDPSVFLVPTTAPEVQPSPNHQFLTDVFTYNHPPYAQMIASAITALKEKGGSSRQAISKYIEIAYKDQLPPTHSTLLTNHLKRLKNDGHLLMNKHSYLLPGSPPVTSPAPSLVPGDSVVSPARKRGRPFKVKAPDVPFIESKVAADIAVPNRNLDASIVDSKAVDAFAAPNRKSERAKKTRLVSGVMEPEKTKRDKKRGPGRPAKILQSMPVMIPYLSDDVVVAPPSKRRGRPKRGGPSEANGTTTAASNGSGVVPGRRSRGRPFGTKRGIGRFAGRPGKGNALPQVPPPGQPLWMVDYGYVKSKVDNIQSRIKQAVSLLRPQFINENTVTIAAALRDLEEISTMDLIGAPFNLARVEQQVLQETLNVAPVQEPVAQNQEPYLEHP